jgi:hypothetical protein
MAKEAEFELVGPVLRRVAARDLNAATAPCPVDLLGTGLARPALCYHE